MTARSRRYPRRETPRRAPPRPRCPSPMKNRPGRGPDSRDCAAERKLLGAAEGELRQVQLAEQNAAGRVQARDRRRVLGRNIAFQDPGSARRAHPGGIELVLYGVGNAVERPQRVATQHGRLRPARRLQRRLRKHRDVSPQARIEALDSLEIELGDLDRRYLALAHERGEPPGTEKREVGAIRGHGGNDSPRPGTGSTVSSGSSQRSQGVDQRVEPVRHLRKIVGRDGQTERRGERAYLFGRQVGHGAQSRAGALSRPAGAAPPTRSCARPASRRGCRKPCGGSPRRPVRGESWSPASPGSPSLPRGCSR